MPTTTASRTMPLADARWGVYGIVKGWGPDGSRRELSGYIILPPRLYTGGFAGGARTGERLLYCVVYEPHRPGQRDGHHIGMYCPPDATLTVLPAPADRPLTVAKTLSRRMPVADLRAGDTFYLWNPDRRILRHLQADPVPAGAGRYTLTVLVDGQLGIDDLASSLWVDVVDPEQHPWQRAGQAVATDPVDLDVWAALVETTLAQQPADEFDFAAWAALAEGDPSAGA